MEPSVRCIFSILAEDAADSRPTSYFGARNGFGLFGERLRAVLELGERALTRPAELGAEELLGFQATQRLINVGAEQQELGGDVVRVGLRELGDGLMGRGE